MKRSNYDQNGVVVPYTVSAELLERPRRRLDAGVKTAGSAGTSHLVTLVGLLTSCADID